MLAAAYKGLADFPPVRDRLISFAKLNFHGIGRGF